MRKCTSCGKEIKENTRFCMHCGQNLSEPVDEVLEESEAVANEAESVVEQVPEAVVSEDESVVEEVPEAVEEITPEEKTADKPESKKKLAVIIAAVALFVCVAVAGTFLVLNIADNNTPVSKEDSEDKNKDDAKEDASGEESAVSEDEAAVSEEDSADNGNEADTSAESDTDTLIPGDFGLEDIETIIDEFNKTTDEERKEELRLILEAIFSQAEGFAEAN